MLSQVSQTCIISPLQKKSFANRDLWDTTFPATKGTQEKQVLVEKKTRGVKKKKKSMNQKSLKTTDVCVYVCLLAVMSITVYYE